jgi:hypothetical protein
LCGLEALTRSWRLLILRSASLHSPCLIQRHPSLMNIHSRVLGYPDRHVSMGSYPTQIHRSEEDSLTIPCAQYIHGNQSTSHYLALDPSFKNPAIVSEKQGLRVTIDSTATWKSQMERTELIPQTSANLGTGNLFYHFSVMRSTTNPPDVRTQRHVKPT